MTHPFRDTAPESPQSARVLRTPLTERLEALETLHPEAGKLAQTLARQHGVSLAAVLCRSRFAAPARARHRLIYLLWTSCDQGMHRTVSVSDIARALGLDHATVMAAIAKMQADLDEQWGIVPR